MRLDPCEASTVRAWGRLLVAGFVTAAFALPAIASAAIYDGAMSFGEITGPSGPEEFSWEVELEPEEELVQIDETEAKVLYTVPGNHVAFTIDATLARDAIGTRVPTTLAVVEPNTITLTVHHREGNPLTGGAPFDYPIVAGAGWEGGFVQVELKAPPGELEPDAKELHIRCGEKNGEVAKVKPAHCRIFGHNGTALWLAFLAELHWHHWGDAVARAKGVAVNPEQHTRKRVRVIAFRSVECNGVLYYDRLRVINPRLKATIRNISPC